MKLALSIIFVDFSGYLGSEIGMCEIYFSSAWMSVLPIPIDKYTLTVITDEATFSIIH